MLLLIRRHVLVASDGVYTVSSCLLPVQILRVNTIPVMIEAKRIYPKYANSFSDRQLVEIRSILAMSDLV